MFEDVTYEGILKRMLDRIPSNQNKREGAVIYDSTAPAAAELENAFYLVAGTLRECYPDTASLPYLIKHAESRGIYHKKATIATLKAVSTPSTIEIPIGTRFSLDSLNYIISEKIKDGEYEVVCETVGDAGNTHFGNMIPIDYIEGLETFELTELITPGTPEEDVESLRARYFQNVSSQAFGGNIADYREKVMSITGVGGVKVESAWEGGGTVLVIIIDSTYKSPSNELIDLVQNELDPGIEGKGYGTAPIGHKVTVDGATSIPINIEADIVYKDGWSWDSTSSYVTKAVEDYITGIAKNWDEKNDTKLIVRISYIEAAILNCEGVLDVKVTKLNGSAENLTLETHQIPTRGKIDVDTVD